MRKWLVGTVLAFLSAGPAASDSHLEDLARSPFVVCYDNLISIPFFHDGKHTMTITVEKKDVGVVYYALSDAEVTIILRNIGAVSKVPVTTNAANYPLLLNCVDGD